MSVPVIADAPTTWWAPRRRLAMLALLSATTTAALAFPLGGPLWRGDLGLLYVAVAALALILPAVVTVQVLTGQLLLATSFLGGEPNLLLLAAAVAGVVATAELLAVVARLDTPMERRPRGDLGRTLAAATVGAAACGAVSLVAGVPGPSGLVAVLLASGAAAVLGLVLGRR